MRCTEAGTATKPPTAVDRAGHIFAKSHFRPYLHLFCNPSAKDPAMVENKCRNSHVQQVLTNATSDQV